MIRSSNNDVYLYIRAAANDYNTLQSYFNKNKYLIRVKNGINDKTNYESISKQNSAQCTGTKIIQQISNMMKTQQNMINIRIQQPINRHKTQWNVGNNNMIMQQQMNKNVQQQNIQQKNEYFEKFKSAKL